MGYSTCKQDPVNIRAPKASFSWFVNDCLIRPGGEFIHDIVSIFSSDEELAHGSLITNSQTMVTDRVGNLTEPFGGRKISKTRFMSFTRVNYMPSKRSKGVKQFLDNRDNCACSGKDGVVATLYGAETTGVNKVPLDINDD